MPKKNLADTMLDGAAADAVRFVSMPAIATLADALDLLAIAAGEWGEAARGLEKAKAEAAERCAALRSGIDAVSGRLRKAAEKRREDEEAYAAAVYEKIFEVAGLFPELSGNVSACRKYATGAVAIVDPIEYVDCGTVRRFEPHTEGMEATLAAFRPARRPLPDTEAVRVDVDAMFDTFARLRDARARYATATTAMEDAVTVCADCQAALAAEADAEAESVKEILDRSGATDTPDGKPETENLTQRKGA